MNLLYFVRQFIQHDRYNVFHIAFAKNEKFKPINFQSLTFRELKNEDFFRCKIFYAQNRQTRYPHRLLMGHVCYGYLRGDEVVAYFWIATPKLGIASAPFEYTYEFQINDSEAYVWDCRTREDFQGQHLYPIGLLKIFNILIKSGIKNAWILSNANNFQSIRGITRAGFTLQGRIRIIVLFGLKFLWRGSSPLFNISLNNVIDKISFAKISKL